MRFENGFWIMNSNEYAVWCEDYERIMNDPNSSDELLMMMEDMNNRIAIED